MDASAAIRQCDANRPVPSWSGCVGRWGFSSGDRYYGQFKNGRFHGLGRFSLLEGVIFVGFFEGGERVGYGVEYTRDGAVLREGYWRGTVFRYEKVNLRSFPRIDELPFNETQYSSGVAAASPVESPLQVATKRIAALEAELIEERRKNAVLQEEARRRVESATSSSVVTKCLGQGLRPGTPEFSRCIGN